MGTHHAVTQVTDDARDVGRGACLGRDDARVVGDEVDWGRQVGRVHPRPVGGRVCDWGGHSRGGGRPLAPY